MVTRERKRSYFDMLDAFKVTTCKHLRLKPAKRLLSCVLKKIEFKFILHLYANTNTISQHTLPSPILQLTKKSFGIEGLMKISRMSTSAEHYVGRDRVHVQLGFRGLPPASEELPLAAARS